MENKKEEKKEAEENMSKKIYWLFIVVVIVWIALGFYPYKLLTTWSERGTFGDMFGAANSLFSALAFCGVIFTIYLQKKELGLQRMELIETRKELSRSAEAQEKSEKALNNQLKSMTLTAKLNALNSLVSIFSEKAGEARTRSTTDYLKYSEKKEMFAGQIEQTLIEIEKLKQDD